MNITKELLEKAKTAQTAEELLKTAKTEGIEMAAEEAERIFAELHKSGELADEELDNVSGGCGKDSKTFRYRIGDHVWFTYDYHTRTSGVISRQWIDEHGNRACAIREDLFTPYGDIRAVGGGTERNAYEVGISGIWSK